MSSSGCVERPAWDWTAVHACCLRASKRVLGPGPEAEDAAQDAALIAWRRAACCHTPEQPWAWIASIAHREALRHAARPRTFPLKPSDEGAAPAHEAAALARIDVGRALAPLTEDERRLLHARYWEDLTQEQIAVALGVPDGTVKIRLHRLRTRLRPILVE